MEIGVFQFDVVFNNKAANLERIEQGLKACAFDLMVLPELCTSGAMFTSTAQPAALAEPVPGGETTDRLIQIARQQDGYIVAGLIEADQGALYNTAVAVGPQGYIGKQRKVNLSTSDRQFFHPGQQFTPLTLAGLQVGILVCYDLWFSEAVLNLTYQGAQLLLNPANFCGQDSLDAIRYCARGSGLPVVSANRLGMDLTLDNGVHFIGYSRILDVTGQIQLCAEASAGVHRCDLPQLNRLAEGESQPE